MTKPQYKVFNRLQRKQVNSQDVQVVEASETSCTIYVAFPGLYLTYDHAGKLIETETARERALARRELVIMGQQLNLNGEMGG